MKRLLLLPITLLLCIVSLCAQQVDTVTIHSKMGHDLKNMVILPKSYAEGNTRYPVVYLLHGCGGNYASWITIKPELPQLASQYNLIIVCPDGLINSWYWNSPLNKDMQFEDYISDEVIRYTDSHYRTIADRSARAISGLSMGGHGAMWNAIRHRNVFGAAGSISGGLDIRPFPTNWKMQNQLGEFASNKKRWDEHTVINLIPSLKDGDLAIIIDCGVDDFFLEVNRRAHQSLLDHNIKHDYIERPGAHNNAYWNNSIDYQLLFFHKFFAQPKEPKK
ncbi:alpha/beta hydrolase family protein [Barnesiella sp. An22]|uniref:alpha/beta hydrolase n=1 Tax=Barnesiella sp. An22 TaxID=1965590 RepID=UPI000B3A8DDD|nr:alpha/beta hydrolase family protein [Barnesiella sp. An22]OUO97644.1 XynC protein [Barnesiella sp. An22]